MGMRKRCAEQLEAPLSRGRVGEKCGFMGRGAGKPLLLFPAPSL
jgi:hypothetical protein